MRLIDADVLKEKIRVTEIINRALYKGEASDEIISVTYWVLNDTIDEMETIDAVKHGYWKMHNTYYTCSVCNADDAFGMTRYCRFCGARMDEVRE